ncbi:YcjF family protein [Thiothrix lacustris]|uniref:YcjF family protein n=1 Tax=Thiothrix lacustris TaxID=525917 RepID=UPI0027E588C9|nr:DUF697 domain-containing protein [Thiothrix lacustris]WMP19457.1 DUF697 domain-containing protein [Thiothrix lacustris]
MTVHETRESSPSATKQKLSQQINVQVAQIVELQAHIEQKEQELITLRGQTSLVDELAWKLQKTEAIMMTATQQAQQRLQIIDELTGQLEQKEQLMVHTTEQAELIDELTARLQEVEIKLAAVSIQNQNGVAQNIAKTHMIAGMSLALLPAPLFDIAALTGTQLNLLRSLSKHYGVNFDEQTGRAVLTSLLSGSVPVLAVIGLSSIAKIIPGIGTMGGGLSMTVLSGAVIYATGQVFIRHFEAGGTFQDFEGKHWQAFFKQQLEEGRAFVKSKLDSAGSKSVGADTIAN